jgi:hypothetical protein
MSGDMVSAERRYLVSVSAPTPSIPAPFHHQQACLFPRGSAATPVTHWERILARLAPSVNQNRQLTDTVNVRRAGQCRCATDSNRAKSLHSTRIRLQ